MLLGRRATHRPPPQVCERQATLALPSCPSLRSLTPCLLPLQVDVTRPCHRAGGVSVLLLDETDLEEAHTLDSPSPLELCLPGLHAGMLPVGGTPASGFPTPSTYRAGRLTQTSSWVEDRVPATSKTPIILTGHGHCKALLLPPAWLYWVHGGWHRGILSRPPFRTDARWGCQLHSKRTVHLPVRYVTTELTPGPALDGWTCPQSTNPENAFYLQGMPRK